jgi:hypothetical protein
MTDRIPDKEGFRNSMGKGFSMTFENGWTVSVQWGPGNYCENRDMNAMAHYQRDGRYECLDSKDAEIAAWDKDGNWYRMDGDSVKGWVRPDGVANFIAKIARKKG